MNKTFVRKILLFLLPVGALICFAGALFVTLLFSSISGFVLLSGLGIVLLAASARLQNKPLGRSTIIAACSLVVGFVLLAAILPHYVSDNTCSRQIAAQTQIECFGNALDQYEIDTGAYPLGTNGLLALLQAPPGETNWRGPYLKVDAIPMDPWGHPYFYQCPGIHNPEGYDLYSLGPKGQNDPISNWTSRR
jgi:general secretion pathway protein G